MFTKKTIQDVSCENKRVLLRADYNVPVAENGTITDDFRIKQSIPTLKALLDQHAKLVIISHLGRPAGRVDSKYSLKPVAARLSELLGQTVAFAPDCIGPEATKAVAALQPGQGLLLEKEVDTITRVMDTPERPLMAIVGGAKISDKIDVLNRFIDIADFIAIGGAMANTFLAAEGIDIAKSKFEANDVPVARDILKKARAKAKRERFIFYIPQDGVVANVVDKTANTRIVDWDAHMIAEVESYPKQPSEQSRTIADDEMLLDIGPFSGAFIAGGIQMANTVVWNGTMGVTEVPSLQGSVGPFAHGTELVIEAMLGDYGHRPFSLVGGGDTVGYIEQRKLSGAFNHVSTGGGASLELMAGRTLPGVAALQDR